MSDEKQCVICDDTFTGWGNNPWPIKDDGQCCDVCNAYEVVPARVGLLMSEQDKKMEAEEIEDERRHNEGLRWPR
tara:strand:- start:449 stop:673 length:225 start_codon:yes stop_codon:yes gene_type:complete